MIAGALSERYYLSMMMKPKFVLAAGVAVTLLEILIAFGHPKGVDKALYSAYDVSALFGCFLASCAMANGLFTFIRPSSVWNNVSGICIPLGVLLFNLSSYFTFTMNPIPSFIGLIGGALLLAGFVTFFAAVIFSREQ